MKKYQLWLERKTYTQHLGNLLRIKMVASERKLGGKITTQQQKVKNLSRYQSQQKLNSSFNGQNLSYIITARQLQHHKLRLVRSKQIVRENEEMVKRINGAKPFIANNKPIDYANYKLKRVRERANVQHSFSQKHKNYQQFARFYDDMPDPTHRFQLVISLQQVQIRMPQRSHQIMLEIIAESSLAKSEFVPPDALRGRKTSQFFYITPTQFQGAIRYYFRRLCYSPTWVGVDNGGGMAYSMYAGNYQWESDVYSVVAEILPNKKNEMIKFKIFVLMCQFQQNMGVCGLEVVD